MSTDFYDRFDKLFPISKDLTSVRKKGVLVEDIADATVDIIQTKLELPIKRDCTTSGFSIHEIYLAGPIHNPTCGLVGTVSQVGIPDYKFGCKDVNLWIEEIRPRLRSMNLIR